MIRQITYYHDRLPAIASVIGTFKNLGECFAGMWTSQLPYCLLWSTEENDGVKSYRPARSISPLSSPPSWSWASVKGGRYHQTRFSKRGTSYLEVHDIGVTVPSHNAGLHVTGGKIRLEGKLFSMSLAEEAATPGISFEIYPDDTLDDEQKYFALIVLEEAAHRSGSSDCSRNTVTFAAIAIRMMSPESPDFC